MQLLRYLAVKLALKSRGWVWGGQKWLQTIWYHTWTFPFQNWIKWKEWSSKFSRTISYLKCTQCETTQLAVFTICVHFSSHFLSSLKRHWWCIQCLFQIRYLYLIQWRFNDERKWLLKCVQGVKTASCVVSHCVHFR